MKLSTRNRIRTPRASRLQLCAVALAATLGLAGAARAEPFTLSAEVDGELARVENGLGGTSAELLFQFQGAGDLTVTGLGWYEPAHDADRGVEIRDLYRTRFAAYEELVDGVGTGACTAAHVGQGTVITATLSQETVFTGGPLLRSRRARP